MNTEQLQDMAWTAEDFGKTVRVHRHDTQTDVIVYVEVDDETYENDELDLDLEPTYFGGREWRE